MSSRGGRDFVVRTLDRLAGPGVDVDVPSVLPADVLVRRAGADLGYYFIVEEVLAAYELLGNDADGVVASHLRRLGLS